MTSRFHSRLRLVTVVVVWMLMPAMAWSAVRVWTDRTGGKIEAELIAAYDDRGYFINKNGAPLNFEFLALCRADFKFVMEWVQSNEPARRERKLIRESNSPLTKFLRDRLVVPGKKRFEKLDVSERREPEFYVLYDGAGWCPPCHRFSPVLSTWYTGLKAGGYENFEVIFISYDQSESEMLQYMTGKQMPWPAVRFRDAGNQALGKYGGRYVPRLVVTDREGQILLHSEAGGEEWSGADGTLSAFSKILNASNRHLQPVRTVADGNDRR